MAVAELQIVLEDVWRGLYGESWKGLICDEAFAHPAKFSRALIRKVYDHVIEEGWATKGSSVVDPFGGVALGAFDAMRHGLYWHGCELEAKFVGLGGQNIALWNERFSRMPNWGSARLTQGDSRKLAEVLGAAECCVSSPPYVSGGHHTDVMGAWNANGGGHGVTKDEAGYGVSEGQLGAMKEGDHSVAITSPPYNLPASQDHNGSRGGQRGTTPSEKGAFVKYGNSEGQLEGMSMDGFAAAVSSPPYVSGGHHNDIMGAWNANGRGQGVSKDEAGYGKTEGQLGAMPEGQLCVTSPPYEGCESTRDTAFADKHHRDIGRDPNGHGAKSLNGTLSSDPANLGNMRGGFEAAISSPPYENAVSSGRDGIDFAKAGRPDKMLSEGYKKNYPIGAGANGDYAYNKQNDDNLGNQQGETFWSASRLILQQLRQVIVPGGHAVFVVKAFVRDKQIVDFPAQWTQLCEAVGFRLLHHHRALLTEHYGTQRGFYEDKELKIKRASFFRRLAEAKGSPSIDWESVLCFVRDH